MLTGTVAGGLYAVGRLAGLLSLLSLAYATVVAAFVVPKVRRAAGLWSTLSSWEGCCCMPRA